MKRAVALFTMGLIALTLCGCLQRRLFWSPDGQRAAVIGNDGLRLCDASGKLSKPVAEDVSLVAWLPDSRHFIAARKTTVKTWEEASAVLSPERREAVLKLAEPLRAEVMAHTGDWSKFKPQSAGEVTPGELTALILYVRDHRREGLPEKMGEKWKEVEAMKAEVHLLQVYEATDTGAAEGQTLLRTLDPFAELRPSRDGKVLAFVQSVSNGELRLSVLPTSGGELRTVAQPVAVYPDWSADDRSLVYATTEVRPPEGSEAIQLGSLTQRRIRDESDAILKDFGKPEDGVGMMFWPELKVRCLRDGRIVFSGGEVSLPAAKDDMPQSLTLFSVDPGKRPTVARLIPRAAEAKLPNGLSDANFELSPDETRIVVGGDDSVAVLTLASGQLEWVVSETGWKTESKPAWRTSEELSVFVPAKSKFGSAERQEVVLWSKAEEARCLSCGWPAIFEKPESQPAK
jgi:hypothetical protein